MRAWLTQDEIPPTRTEYVLTLPSSWEWRAQFLGAFVLLAKDENWEQFGSLSPQQMADEWLELFLLFESDGVRLMPVGTIMAFAGAVAPDGWLLCDGQAISRVDYADLFALVDLTYGFGNGSTTFNIPDLRGRVAVGRSTGDSNFDFLGEWGGESDHELTVSELASHSHTQNSHTHQQDSHNHTQDAHQHNVIMKFRTATVSANSDNPESGDGSVGTGPIVVTDLATASNQATTATNQSTTATNNNSGGGSAHNNLQPYVTLNYIIKY